MASSSKEYVERLQKLSHGIQSSYTVVIVVTTLLVILLGAFAYFTFMEEWTKWKEFKQRPKRTKLAEKSHRRKKRRTRTTSKSAASKSSKSSSMKRSKPKAAAAVPAPEASTKENLKKKDETIVVVPTIGVAKEPKSKKESASKLSTDVNAASCSPPHVKFAAGIKDNSDLMSAKKYQSVETKYPDASTFPQAGLVVTPSMTAAALLPEGRSDVSPASKQLHSSKCPGTGSFGTSLVSTFPTASSSASNTSLNQMKDAIIPPTPEHPVAPPPPASAPPVVAASNASALPKIYKPHEVPSLFSSDGAVTAREETDQISQTQATLTPTSSSLIVTDVTPMATSATQSSALSLSSTQGTDAAAAATTNASKTSLVGNETMTTTTAESIPSKTPSSSSMLSIDDTQSGKTLTPKK